MYKPRRVYVANAKTKQVDAWICTGEIRAIYRGKPETLCLLERPKTSCALPIRCVFETEEAARAALNTLT